MADEKWDQVKDIFHAARQLEPDEQERFVRHQCGEDKALLDEVKSLLEMSANAESFLEKPAVEGIFGVGDIESIEPAEAASYSENETVKFSRAENDREIPDTASRDISTEQQYQHRTNYKTITKTVSPAESLIDSQRAHAGEPADENALQPSRLRFALVCVLFALMAGWLVISVYYHRQSDNNYSLEKAFREGKTDKDSYIRNLLEGDEIVSLNNVPFEDKRQFFYTYNFLKPNETFVLRVKRGDDLLDVEFTTRPFPPSYLFDFYFFYILIPATFLITGFTVFLLKPNDKQAVLLAVAFILCSPVGVSNRDFWVEGLELPQVLTVWHMAAKLAFLLFMFLPVFLHLFLVFPQRSKLLQRFPRLEFYIYLPHLFLFVLPMLTMIVFTEKATAKVWERFLPIEVFAGVFFGTLSLYITLIVTALLFGYIRAGNAGKRRIRLLVFIIIIVSAPILIKIPYEAVILFDRQLYHDIYSNYQNFFSWLMWFSRASMILIPVGFAYAIVKHRVIPVALVIRRGLQYLLAKNALRLMVFLPVAGIIRNIAVSPERTLGEILFRNSFDFYLFLTLAAGSGLLTRFRLQDWIDRRFFREQYDQEMVLRELIENVKESDSMGKLSRLVTSQIQNSLHPASVHFFYEESNDTDFSVVYTTSENSDNLRITADSPLLDFMRQKDGAVELPVPEEIDLPKSDRHWLREIGANLLVPMHGTDGKLAGFFSLGEKKSEIPYTGRDKRLLETLAHQIALVHENLNLKESMRRERQIKTEILSRFDEGSINLLKECPRCGKCFDRETERCDADNAELTLTMPVERTIEKRYRLERLLGRGGMGAVYEATDLRINRRVAVKILSGAMFGNQSALRRFEREAQTAGRLHHRNIVTVFDYGALSTEGAFLVLELVEGESLSRILKRKKILPVETVATWFRQVLDGVEEAHKAGIIHRDLKPDNILVTHFEDGSVRLCILDFGLARFSEYGTTDSVTVPGMIMGTLGYMAPEQLRGERASELSDLFAVGVMIYEALRGEKPFPGKNYQEIRRSMSDQIVFPEDEPFADFFKTCLALAPVNRPTSAGQMKKLMLKTLVKDL